MRPSVEPSCDPLWIGFRRVELIFYQRTFVAELGYLDWIDGDPCISECERGGQIEWRDLWRLGSAATGAKVWDLHVVTIDGHSEHVYKSAGNVSISGLFGVRRAAFFLAVAGTLGYAARASAPDLRGALIRLCAQASKSCVE